MTLLCLDAHAASWLPRGRVTKYLSDSATEIFAARPVTPTGHEAPALVVPFFPVAVTAPVKTDEPESITRLQDFLLGRLIFIRSNRSELTDMRMNTALYHLF